MIKQIIVSLIGILSISSITHADSYVFRQPIHGVNSSSSIPGEDPSEIEPIENAIDCYSPESVGKIGNSGVCNDMLIVSTASLRAASSSCGYGNCPDGNESFSILNTDSNGNNRLFTFENSADNIFTGQVTDMSSLFRDVDFNGDIGYWDTSNVVNMSGLFAFSWPFDQDISGWDVSNVTDFSYMFFYAQNFNKAINNWNTESAINMTSMFDQASIFNQNISSWNTSNVTNMSRMFEWTENFNQNISNWDVSNVTNMTRTFYGAMSFNQDISSWCVSNISSKPYNFDASSSFEGLSSIQPQWGVCPQ